MTAPNPEQLDILLTRADRRQLDVEEVAVLRAAITYYADQQKQAGATIAGLQNRIRELKQKAAAAEREAAAATPYQRACPTCGAQPRERCKATRGFRPPVTPHAARLQRAAA